MKIGAVYPQIELGGDPAALDEIGRAVEALGYEHILFYDHVVGAVHENRNPPLWERGPYTDKHPFHDPLVALAYLAGVTRRIGLVTGVLILPQRQTVLVAKQCTDVDLLSGGRLCVGVGSGWNYVEYDALGEDFKTRGDRLTEQIGYLRRLWSEPLLTFEGRFDRIDRANINPRPKRSIPIFCGGFSEPAYRRAAKLADGFIFGASVENSALPGWTRVQELLKEAGRPVAGFGAHWLVQDDYARGPDPEVAVDSIRRWRDVGGTHCSVVTMGRRFTTAREHIDHLATMRRQLEAAGLAS
jgi:probable F420-dependent oxidoreductase